MKALSIIATACGGLALAACSEPGSYEVAGVIQKIDTANARLVIEHEAIPGYMPAMTMAFALADASQAKDLAVGDRVKFEFTPEDGEFAIANIGRVKPEDCALCEE